MTSRLNAVALAGVLAGVLAGGPAILLLAGCSVGGSTSASRANDELRRRVMALEDQKKTLEQTNAELLAKVSEWSKERGPALPADVLAAMPRCASISISDLGTWLDPADVGKPATSAHVSVSCLDGRGRSMQGVGTLRVEVMVLPAGETIVDSSGGRSAREGATPIRTAKIELGPSALRDAYREGLFGASYVVDLPLEPLAERSAVVLVRASFADAITGATHEATKLVDVH
ncbi:MAG: bZIP transcription factor [Phycisphaerales bacterium]|nr:bZIP transcription factor [Phycisphaerales bacterium]